MIDGTGDRKRLLVCKPDTANTSLGRKSRKKLSTSLDALHLAVSVQLLGSHMFERFEIQIVSYDTND